MESSQDHSYWGQLNWETEALRAVIGLVDNPQQAEQFPLMVDLTSGNVALLGAPGSGKTTFLRTLLLSLAALHSPETMHIYAFDCGGGSLEILKSLPHLVALILPNKKDTEERTRRIFARLTKQLLARQGDFSKAHTDSLSDYNMQSPDCLLPALVVVIDNFAGFTDQYGEDAVNLVLELTRDGRAYGIYFVITADQMGAISRKLLAMFSTVLALKLADSSVYSELFGKTLPSIEQPGRGYVKYRQEARQFQIAVISDQSPKQDIVADYEAGDDLNTVYQLANAMTEVWGERQRPDEVGLLPERITLGDLFPNVPPDSKGTVFGMSDNDLTPANLVLTGRRPHLILSGTPASGRTTTLQTLGLSLAYTYSPEQVRMCLIDTRGQLSRYGDENQFTWGDLPHVMSVVSGLEELNGLLEQLIAFYTEPPAGNPAMYLLIDNYDELSLRLGSSGVPAVLRENWRKVIIELLRRQSGLHGIVALAQQQWTKVAADDIFPQLLVSAYGLALSYRAAESFGLPPLRVTKELPVGRGIFIQGGAKSLIQLALPSLDSTAQTKSQNDAEGTIKLIEAIRTRYPSV